MTYDAIILRLAGPMQAWGAPTTEDTRPVYPFPTRSGLTGLIGACLGVPHDERHRLVPLSESFRYAVRRDTGPYEPGIMVDYQTIQNVPTADNKTRTVESPREYLVDTRFTAVLVATGVGSPSFDEIERALLEPHFTPVLGRKCCLPTEPIFVRRTATDNPLTLLAATAPGSGYVWSEFAREGAGTIEVRDVPTAYFRRCYTRTVNVFQEN